MGLPCASGCRSGKFAEENLTYVKPHYFVEYAESIDTPCGLIDQENAIYCTWERDGTRFHAIYYNTAFLQKALARHGDFAAASIIAHEWGHLVQNLLGIFLNDLPTIYKELQAIGLQFFIDCWQVI